MFVSMNAVTSKKVSCGNVTNKIIKPNVSFAKDLVYTIQLDPSSRSEITVYPIKLPPFRISS